MPVKSPAIAPRRGRPARIDRARIVTKAIELGLDSFSLDDIAEHLDVTLSLIHI